MGMEGSNRGCGRNIAKSSKLFSHPMERTSVAVEVTIDRQALRLLGVSCEAILDFQQVAMATCQSSGVLGHHLSLASDLTALYLATGQDGSSVAENASGFSQAAPDGGRTRLPSQRRSLEKLGCGNRLHDARKFAEIIGACAAAVELAMLADVVSGNLSRSPGCEGTAGGLGLVNSDVQTEGHERQARPPVDFPHGPHAGSPGLYTLRVDVRSSRVRPSPLHPGFSRCHLR